MESYNKYSDYSEHQLLFEIEQAKKWHEAIKKEIVDITIEIEKLEKIANEKLKNLENIEKNYVDLMKELTNRQE
jgi:predicted  nucleic acid-binding Zn-ribbon protein